MPNSMVRSRPEARRRAALLTALLALLPTTAIWGGPPGIPFATETSFEVRDFQPRIDRTGPINEIARNPADPFEVFAASTSAGLWKSSDGGDTWSSVRSLPSWSVSAIAYLFDGTYGGALLVTTREDFRTVSGAGVWRSDDHGVSWTKAADVPGGCAEPRRAHGIVSRGSVAYVATSCGILKGRRVFLPYGDDRFPAGSFRGVGSKRFYSVVLTPAGDLLVAGEAGVFLSAGGRGRFGRVTAPGTFSQTGEGGWGFLKRGLASTQPSSGPGWLVALAGTQATHSMLVSGDGGRIWQSVPSSPSSGAGGLAGGSPFVRILPQAEGSQTLYVYYGDGLRLFRCGPFTGGDLSALRAPGTPCPQVLPGHPDPHDVDFVHFLGAGLGDRRLLVATDGGLEVATFGTDPDALPASNEALVLPTSTGLAPIQVMNVKGQIVGEGEARQERLYMDTWHTDAWALADAGDAEAAWVRIPGETAWLELERRVASASDAQVVWNYNPFPSYFGDDLMQNQTTFPDAHPTTPLANPLMIRKGIFVEPFPTIGSVAVAATPDVTRETVSTPGWATVASLTGCSSGFGCTPVSIYKAPLLGGFLGADSTDALVYQPLSSGQGLAAIRGIVALDEDRNPVLDTASAVFYARMRWIDAVSLRVLGNVRLGETQTPNTGFGNLPVLGVDPGRPWHVLAPDSENGKVMESFNGGDTWIEVRSLSELVRRNAAGELRFRFSAASISAHTMVSAIAFCPENPNLVLVGTVENGLFFSSDRAATWRRVPGSEHITNVSAIHWRSANSAVVGSWGRGLFEIAMRHRLSASALALVCGDACRELRLTSLPLRADLSRSPLSPAASFSFDSAVLVLDGRATGAAIKDGRLQTLWVTPGSNVYLFSNDKTAFDFVSRPRSGFVGFEGLAEVDALRANQEVIKGFGFTAGKLTHALFDDQESRTPGDPPGQPRLPKATTPFISGPYLTLSGMGMAVAVGGQTYQLQGWRFDPGTSLRIEMDGKLRLRTRTDSQGSFEVSLKAPGAMGRYTLRARRPTGRRPQEAAIEFSVGNRD